MPDYELSYSADSIDNALGKVVNQDNTPSPTSGNTVSSSGIYSHVSAQVAAVDRNTQVDDHETRITALEGVPTPLDRGVLYISSIASGRTTDGKFDLGSPTVKVSDSNIIQSGDNFVIPTGTWIVEVDGFVEPVGAFGSGTFSAYLRQDAINRVAVADNYNFSGGLSSAPIYCFFKIEVTDPTDNLSLWMDFGSLSGSFRLSEGTCIKATRYA